MSERKYEVGDELVFPVRFGGGWRIEKIKRIMPSGRMQCGPWILNPDLRGGSYGPSCRWGRTVMSERHFRVAFYMNNYYEVLELDSVAGMWISRFIGSLADCEAWIRLTDNENVDF